jgi:hypothetical protein
MPPWQIAMPQIIPRQHIFRKTQLIHSRPPWGNCTTKATFALLNRTIRKKRKEIERLTEHSGIISASSHLLPLSLSFFSKTQVSLMLSTKLGSPSIIFPNSSFVIFV